jgi:hypothetical protein
VQLLCSKEFWCSALMIEERLHWCAALMIETTMVCSSQDREYAAGDAHDQPTVPW